MFIISKKSHYISMSIIFFGGDEGSRTPVQNIFQTNIYKFSLFFIFIIFTPTNRFKYNISFKIPITSKEKVNSFPTKLTLYPNMWAI